MTLSNNSTPAQSVEIVDPEGSCKKDNTEPVSNVSGPHWMCKICYELHGTIGGAISCSELCLEDESPCWRCQNVNCNRSCV